MKRYKHGYLYESGEFVLNQLREPRLLSPLKSRAKEESFISRYSIFLCMFRLILLFITLGASAQQGVTVTEIDENIPTYLSGDPEPNPMFFFGQGTQGAEQRIYPYPLYDNLTNKKADKSYHFIYLENEYVKIGISPELGGRLFSALDKTNNYDFIYKQHVIKPALIGLTGAWISGGVEWNIPHHHRASTFSPVQYSIEHGADGSKTVWVGELEIRHRMRWSVGYTIRPGSSIVECQVRISNRTPIENTMLCFANIAVHVNENYQVIFPPHTQWSTSHAKREFNPWPMVDGVDMSWYKNNKKPNSWFAVNERDDFVAGYDHGKNSGILSIANHRTVQGKKFFTWGTGNMWDQILTDDDGPYLEIMVGAYSDNQPDYSWLQPAEARSFVMTLFPFQGIHGVKNATLDAAVNLEVKDGKAVYGFYTTRAFDGATALLKAGDRVLAEKQISIDPANPYTNMVAIPAGVDEDDLRASIVSGGKELVAYSPMRMQSIPEPPGYAEPKKPEEIENIEDLFLVGQRIGQFHNPSLDANQYWEEVLRRDPGHILANTGMGIFCLRKAEYAKAEKYFNKAIERLTAHYTTPKNVEPIYYLAVTQKAQGKLDEAFDTFYKATWKQEWKGPAFYSLAEIASTQGNYESALDLVNQSLYANASNVRAYVLKSALLRHLGRPNDARKVVAFGKEKCDPLDAQLMAEEWLTTGDAHASMVLFSTLKNHPLNAEEIAAGYMNFGLWDDGDAVLSQLIAETKNKRAISPLVYYYLGYFAEKMGNAKKASDYRAQARLQPLDYVFPFQYEMIPVLQSAIKGNPDDARAPYYLGNLLFDWQPEEAIALWKKSSGLDPKAPITWRNLAVAYSHQKEEGATVKAIACLEKAVDIADPYPTHLAELVQLYKSAGTSVQRRLALLEKNQKVVVKKDDALGHMINLKIFAGKADEAISLMENRVFNIWEGGGAFNTGQAWADANLIRGLNFFSKKKYHEAIAAFQIALVPPENLRAERPSTRVNQIKYWMACAYEAVHDQGKATQLWNEVVTSDLTYWKRSPGLRQVQQYLVALSQEKLNPHTDVESVFKKLIDIENNMTMSDDANNDYQFVRVNNKVTLDQQAYPYYLSGLGYLGLRDKLKAKKAFEKALAVSPDFLSARIELNQMK